jgi:hypothetical protein
MPYKTNSKNHRPVIVWSGVQICLQEQNMPKSLLKKKIVLHNFVLQAWQYELRNSIQGCALTPANFVGGCFYIPASSLGTPSIIVARKEA